MALATPLTITINAVPYSLPCIYVLGSRSEYQDSTGLLKAIVSHKYTGTRVSRLCRVEQKLLQADGTYSKHSFHTVNEYDTNKVTSTQVINLEVGVAAFKAAGTNAVIVKMTGGES
jgi:hypothetical protein